MEKYLAEAKMRSAPPVPFKFMAMGTIPVIDPDFLKWKETQEVGLWMMAAMARYMPHINADRRETFDEEWTEHQAFLEFTRLEGIRKMAAQQSELDSLKARIAEQQTKNEALAQTLILTPEITPQWLPWPGTAYAVPLYPAVPDYFFVAPSDEKTVIR
jgi:hypothetical protein